MPKSQKRLSTDHKYAVIYNPHAGTKRKILPNPTATSLEDIKHLLEQYQIRVEYFPTKYAGHATILAQELAKKGFNTILAAGGDGTVGEVANGLVKTEATLGVLPLGSFMNVARMLSIPLDIEKAVQLIKINRTRKIDVGVVNRLSGEKLDQPYYFIESAGIGLEAQLQEYFLELEKGDKKALFRIFKTFFDFYGHPGKITADGKEINTRAILVAVSNGPYTGANIPLAPKAKLNDHKLTLSLFKMSKWELLNYIFMITRTDKRYSRKVETLQAKKIRIETKVKRLVHVDARLYGETPVVFSILPSALNVITGFPEPGKSSLVKRTYLDP